MASDLPPVAVIAGRYRIERRLGRGGMGSVWKAEHLLLHSPVALKLIAPALAASEEARTRFLREAQAAAVLRSPHVVQLLDYGIDANAPYIVMELLEGENLADRLARVGKLSPEEATQVMTQVARAMTRAHAAGIVHRDLKPENVFLVQNDDEALAKVLDFGIAKADGAMSDANSGTRTGAIMGTPFYMSPEQVEGSKQVDHRSDLWAMAVMTFECLLGQRPFDGPSLGSVMVQICAKPISVPSELGPVPPGFDAWFLRATARDPSQRFQSAKEQAEALRAALGGAVEARAPKHETAPLMLTPSDAGALTAPGRVPSFEPVISQVPGVRRTPWSLYALIGAAALALFAAYWALRAPEPQAAHVVTPAPPVAAAPVLQEPAPAPTATVEATAARTQPEAPAPEPSVAEAVPPTAAAEATQPALEATEPARLKPTKPKLDKPRVSEQRALAPALQPSAAPKPASSGTDLGF